MKFKYIYFLIIVLISSCNSNKDLKFVKFGGYAQGTTYSISYFDKNGTNYQHDIDSILKDFDNSLSIYNPKSLVSRINMNEADDIGNDNYFRKAFIKSLEVSKISDGAFDITVCPLVNAWGFGFKHSVPIDKHLVDSLMQFVGYKLIELKGNKIVKKDSRVMLDFNAIAQGYSVDIISRYLESKDISNYIVEIGGEVFAKGKKLNGELWKVGIDKPIDNSSEDNRKLQVIIHINNRAIATSGNYRKFVEIDGKKYSHHIDPKTGSSTNNNLLSASVLANDCITADAFGTAFLVLGLEKTKKILGNHPELDAYLIFSNSSGEYEIYYTKGFKNLIVKEIILK